MEKGIIQLYFENTVEFLSQSGPQRHRHNCYEISWLIGGAGQYWRGERIRRLSAGDLVVFNPFEEHFLSLEKDSMLAQAFVVGHFFLDELEQESQVMPKFLCAPEYINSKNKGSYEELRLSAAKMFYSCRKQEDFWQIKKKAQFYESVHILLRSFVGVKSRGNVNNNQWIWEVLRYIHEHIREPLPLPELAEAFFLTPSYFSRRFKEKTGISPVKYISRERTRLAAELLLTTEKNITEIALACGFNNIKSFEVTFAGEFGISPLKYRRNSEKWVLQSETAAKGEISQSFEEAMARFIRQQREKSRLPAPVRRMELVPLVTVDAQKTRGEWGDSWRHMVNVGNASDLLDADIQYRILLVQKEIHFRYIHFHGILDDSMRVYQEDSRGNPVLSFMLVDKLLDFVLRAGLKPYMEFTFMPRQLASSQKYEYNGYHCKPKSQEKWNRLLTGLLTHCMERYSPEEVETWMFQIWDSAFITGWWNDSREDFCRFYQSSYEALREISPNIKIGMPSINTVSLIHARWLELFLQDTQRHGCTPDFISLSVYPHEAMGQVDPGTQMLDMTGSDNNLLENPLTLLPSLRPSYMAEGLELLQEKLKKLGLSRLPVYITQWNSNNIPGFYARDTVQNGAYMAKNICENYERAASFGYWILTDEKEEYTASSRPFNGGMGLISNFGFKMPGYHVLELLAKMKGKLLHRQEGIFITKDQSALYILLYHYVHFRADVRENALRKCAHTDRYRFFEEGPEKGIHIVFDNLPEGDYKISEYVLDRQHGSCLDIWEGMGRPQFLSREDIQYIQEQNQMQRKISYQKIEKRWELSRVLERFKVCLIVLKREK